MIRNSLASMLALALLSSCGGSPTPSGTDADTRDSGVANDAATADGAATDAASVAPTHGCEEADFVDLTAGDDSTRTIAVTSGALTFTPSCITVRAGQSVTFGWDFTPHPLGVGLAPGHRGMATTPSPIVAQTTGTSYTTAFPTEGNYPFYCTVHFHVAMYGVVRVIP